MSEQKERSVAESRIEMSRLVRPQHADFSDNAHGAVILGLMDEAAYLCPSRYAERYAVVAAGDRVELDVRIRVGERVTLEAGMRRLEAA